MLDPRGHRLQPRRPGEVHHLPGSRIGGDVDVLDRLAQQGIADRAAHDQRAVRGQRPQHPAQGRIAHNRPWQPHADSLFANASSTRAVAPQM